MMQDQPPHGPWMPALYELATAAGAAFLAGYVRAKADPRPFSLPSLCARGAEAVVCGFLAIGISAAMDQVDHRLTVGISAALGLLGTGVISDLATRFLAARAGKS
jgi:hypothetical protein